MTQTDNPYQGRHVQITQITVFLRQVISSISGVVLASATQHTFQKCLHRKYVIPILFTEVVMHLFDNSVQKVYLLDLLFNFLI